MANLIFWSRLWNPWRDPNFETSENVCRMDGRRDAAQLNPFGHLYESNWNRESRKCNHGNSEMAANHTNNLQRNNCSFRAHRCYACEFSSDGPLNPSNAINVDGNPWICARQWGRIIQARQTNFATTTMHHQIDVEHTQLQCTNLSKLFVGIGHNRFPTWGGPHQKQRPCQKARRNLHERTRNNKAQQRWKRVPPNELLAMRATHVWFSIVISTPNNCTNATPSIARKQLQNGTHYYLRPRLILTRHNHNKPNNTYAPFASYARWQRATSSFSGNLATEFAKFFGCINASWMVWCLQSLFTFGDSNRSMSILAKNPRTRPECQPKRIYE